MYIRKTKVSRKKRISKSKIGRKRRTKSIRKQVRRKRKTKSRRKHMIKRKTKVRSKQVRSKQVRSKQVRRKQVRRKRKSKVRKTAPSINDKRKVGELPDRENMNNQKAFKLATRTDGTPERYMSLAESGPKEEPDYSNQFYDSEGSVDADERALGLALSIQRTPPGEAAEEQQPGSSGGSVSNENSTNKTYYSCCPKLFEPFNGTYKWVFKPVLEQNIDDIKKSVKYILGNDPEYRELPDDYKGYMQPRKDKFYNQQNYRRSLQVAANIQINLQKDVDDGSIEDWLVIIPKFQSPINPQNFQIQIGEIQEQFQKEMEIYSIMSKKEIAPKLYEYEGKYIMKYDHNEVYYSLVKDCETDLKPFDNIEMDKLSDLIEKIVDNGYVYLDIKPANIVKTKDSGELRFVDFGPEFCIKIPDGIIDGECKRNLIEAHKYIYLICSTYFFDDISSDSEILIIEGLLSINKNFQSILDNLKTYFKENENNIPKEIEYLATFYSKAPSGTKVTDQVNEIIRERTS